MPERVQFRRTKGWRKPEGVVYVGRPTIYGNPYHVDHVDRRSPTRARQHQRAVDSYRTWLAAHPALLAEMVENLRGRDLGCWCPIDLPCHADVLLELVNAPALPSPSATDPYRECPVYLAHGACSCSTGYPSSCVLDSSPSAAHEGSAGTEGDGR